MSQHFAVALLVALGALVAPLVCRPLRVPAAVGEILVGILLGPYVLGVGASSVLLSHLALLGLLLLMFMVGLEIDFAAMRRAGARGMAVVVTAVALLLASAFAVVHLMGFPPFMGLVLAALSLGIPLMVLHERGLTSSALGQRVLLVGSLGEFTVLLLATLAQAAHAAGRLDFSLVLDFGRILLLLALVAGVLWIFRTAFAHRPQWFARVLDLRDPSEVGVRAGLSIMFFMAALAETLGADAVLGAFAAGALFSFVFHSGGMQSKLVGLANGFFVPLFFVNVGATLDLPAAMQARPTLLLELTVLLVTIRLVACTPFLLGGVPAREVAGTAVLLSAPLTLLVLLSGIGQSSGLLTSGMRATVVLLALLTAVLGPIAFRFLVPPGAPEGPSVLASGYGELG